MTQHPFDPDVPDGMTERNQPGESADTFESFDELSLRRLMQDAVRAVEPQPEALDRLRQAIPARRTRRRQAMVGAAAGVLLVGTAVPAVLHAATTGGTDTVGAATTSSSHTTGSSPGAVGDPDQDGGGSGPATATGPGTGSTARPSPLPSASRSGSRGTAQSSGGVLAVTSPNCARAQLGKGTAQAGTPDQQGRVYGSFRVVNISSTSCTVSGEGQISVTAQGSTDPSRIQVVDHTAGDPASGLLPDPATAPDSVTLPPGKAYQVDFAWIPAAGGGTSGCAAASTGGSASTTGGTSGSTGAGNAGPNAGDAGASGTPATANTPAASDSSSGGGTPPSPPANNGITLSDTPDAGPPTTASTTINGACAGTVYRTPALPAS